MNLIELSICGISYSETKGAGHALILHEVNGERVLPIVVGEFEAQSVAIILENEMLPPRPLTHDLFKNFAESYGIEIEEIIISKLEDGVFYSNIVCNREGEEKKVFDARTSDAIALAVRFKTPIYIYQNVLDEIGIVFEKEDVSKLKNKFISEYKGFSTEELKAILRLAIEREDYESAANLRDELNRR